MNGIVISFDEILTKLTAKISKLELATLWLLSDDQKYINNQLSEANAEALFVESTLTNLRQERDAMQEQNNKLSRMIATVKKLDQEIVHLTESVPEEVLQEFVELNRQMTPCNDAPHDKSMFIDTGSVRSCNVGSKVTGADSDTPELRMEDCKKKLFKNVEGSYSIDPLSNEEFAAIPKYIIGRQSLGTLNELIATINQILKFKYELLALGKNKARKKGKLDLYLSLQREEIVTGAGEDPVYFFTAEDYYRHTQTKLDKTKLNLLTALRHSKRLRELRVGKILQYVVIPS